MSYRVDQLNGNYDVSSTDIVDDRSIWQKLGIAPTTGSNPIVDNLKDSGDWNGLNQYYSENPQNVFESWFNSEETAERDFARQLAAQQYQNVWESAPEQMKRAKEAGINLNTAAAGIVGSASGASPMSAPQTDSVNPLSSVADLANAVTGGVGNIAGAAKSLAEKDEIKTLLPSKAYSLNISSLLSLENIGLTTAQAQAISIANQYEPMRLQLGISKMALELPFMMKQMEVFDSEYNKNIEEANLFKQKVTESKATVSLMDYQAANLHYNALKAKAEADLINKRFQLLRDMNWDPATGLQGLVGTYLVNPNFNKDDLNMLVDNLAQYSYDMARFKFLGDNNLDLTEGKSLFELNAESQAAASYSSRNDIPVDISVGPFKTSTNLRDFFHEKNNKPHFGNSRKNFNTYYNK